MVGRLRAHCARLRVTDRQTDTQTHKMTVVTLAGAFATRVNYTGRKGGETRKGGRLGRVVGY